MKNAIALTMVSAMATAIPSQAAKGLPSSAIVLENQNLRAEIVPAWAGRLMFFGRKDGENILWTQPEAADFGCHPSGTPMWKNVGGEKTWVGSQGQGWCEFAGKTEGGVWPPPAWFDSMPFRVVKADPKSAVLRSSTNRGGDWVVAIEREFTLEEDKLVIRQRLIAEDFGARGPKPLPDDDRRLWSIAQVPQPRLVMMRLCGEGRHIKFGPLPAPEPEDANGWSRLPISASPEPGKICADGDALAMPLADGDWLLIEQTAPQRFLDAIAEPGRAMVYVSPDNFEPSAYAELEFAAYGPDAEQTLSFSIRDELPPR